MENRIRAARIDRDMSQEDLAKKSGISRSIISGLESGRITVVKTSTIQKIASALDKSVSEIFFRQDV